MSHEALLNVYLAWYRQAGTFDGYAAVMCNLRSPLLHATQGISLWLKTSSIDLPVLSGRSARGPLERTLGLLRSSGCASAAPRKSCANASGNPNTEHSVSRAHSAMRARVIPWCTKVDQKDCAPTLDNRDHKSAFAWLRVGVASPETPELLGRAHGCVPKSAR